MRPVACLCVPYKPDTERHFLVIACRCVTYKPDTERFVVELDETGEDGQVGRAPPYARGLSSHSIHTKSCRRSCVMPTDG
jgi:hypothetical protein|eukprot:6536329-Prymnesium_polylepis.1